MQNPWLEQFDKHADKSPVNVVRTELSWMPVLFIENKDDELIILNDWADEVGSKIVVSYEIEDKITGDREDDNDDFEVYANDDDGFMDEIEFTVADDALKKII